MTGQRFSTLPCQLGRPRKPTPPPAPIPLPVIWNEPVQRVQAYRLEDVRPYSHRTRDPSAGKPSAVRTTPAMLARWWAAAFAPRPLAAALLAMLAVALVPPAHAATRADPLLAEAAAAPKPTRTPAVAARARPHHSDIGTTMFLMEPPAAPQATTARANRCTVVNLVESIHADHGDGPQATWVFRLQCRRNPEGMPLTLRFSRPARTCTARGWGYPSAASTDIEVIAERCHYTGAHAPGEATP